VQLKYLLWPVAEAEEPEAVAAELPEEEVAAALLLLMPILSLVFHIPSRSEQEEQVQPLETLQV
jgi:hypothetical protein